MNPLPAAGVRQIPACPLKGLAALVAAAILLTAIPGSAQEKQGAPAPQTSATPTANKPAEYIGSEMCAACHEDISKAFAKNPHHEVETTRNEASKPKPASPATAPAASMPNP